MSAAMRFWKMSGAGNDFIVLRRQDLPTAGQELARRLCPRGLSVGADGLLCVEHHDGARVDVAYWNADGSPARFCGNGARCAALFASLHEGAPEAMTLHFSDLEVDARVSADGVLVRIPRPRVIETLDADLAGIGASAPLLVDSGVEHVVIHVEDAETADLVDIVQSVFALRPGLRGRANVTLVSERGGRTLRLRTWERGCGETLACGSGALAAAAWSLDRADSPSLTVLPNSGIALTVRPAGGGAQLELVGEARVVYRGEVDWVRAES